MSYDIEELIYMITNGQGLDPNAMAAAAAVSMLSSILSLALGILTIIAMWKIFQKAGEKGWKAIIPIYNSYILFKIAWKKAPFWISFILGLIITGLTFAITWNTALYASGNVAEDLYLKSLMIEGGILLVLCIPLFIISLVLYFKLAKSFGKGFGFFLGLVFLNIIFICILGFGAAQYVGSNGGKNPVPAAPAAPATPAYDPYAYVPQAQAPVSYSPVSTAAPVQTYAPTTTVAPAQTYTTQTYAAPSVYTPTSGTYEAPKTPFTPQE